MATGVARHSPRLGSRGSRLLLLGWFSKLLCQLRSLACAGTISQGESLPALHGSWTRGQMERQGEGTLPAGRVRRWPHTGRTPLRAAEGTDASLGFRLPHPEIRPPRLLVTAAHGSWLHDHLSWLGWAGQGRAGRVQWLGYVIGHRPAWVAPSPHCHTAGGWGPSWAVSGAWALTAWQLSSKSKFSERQGVRAAGRSSAHDWRGDPPSTLPSSKRCHRPARPQARRQEETDKGGGHRTFCWEVRPSSSLKNVPRHPLGSQLLTGK